MLKIKHNEVNVLLDFLCDAYDHHEYDMDQYRQFFIDVEPYFECAEYKGYRVHQKNMLSIGPKLRQYKEENRTGGIEFNVEEAKTIYFLMDYRLINYIKEVNDFDDLNWVKCMCNIHERCREFLNPDCSECSQYDEHHKSVACHKCSKMIRVWGE